MALQTNEHLEKSKNETITDMGGGLIYRVSLRVLEAFLLPPLAAVPVLSL
jgi:hypothetical protein